MKVMVKTREGAQREVESDNVLVNGVTLVTFYKDFLITKKRLDDFIRIYQADNEEVLNLWKKVK